MTLSRQTSDDVSSLAAWICAVRAVALGYAATMQGRRKVFLSGEAQASCGQSPQPPTGGSGGIPPPPESTLP